MSLSVTWLLCLLSSFFCNDSPQVVLPSTSNKVPSGICDMVSSESGYFFFENDKKYFYWFFESRNDPHNDPVVLWLNGGPGCSSEIGLFYGNGPCKLEANNKTTKVNPFSWNNRASVIYLDQPTGVGFSKGSVDERSALEIKSQILLFIKEFYERKPHLLKNKFFVAGESYAGHTLPNIARAILDNNAIQNTKINLKGIAIGNGLLDPFFQYKNYCEYALNNHYRSLISREEYVRVLYKTWLECLYNLYSCASDRKNETLCLSAFFSCEALVTDCSPEIKKENTSVYNIKKKCNTPPLCYDFSGVEVFLGQPSVRKALGVDDDTTWNLCNKRVYSNFLVELTRNYASVVESILEDNVLVLNYAGDLDYICNWMGNKEWAENLNWRYAAHYSSSPLKPWSGDGGTVKGEIKRAENLIFLRIFNSGHMVPMDQPEVALLMFNQFMENTLNYD